MDATEHYDAALASEHYEKTLELVHNTEKPATFLVVAMFFVSGVLKLIPKSAVGVKDMTKLRNAIGSSYNITWYFIKLIGLYEICAVSYIIYDLYSEEEGRLSSMSSGVVLSLIAFTSLANLLFYTRPSTVIQFMSNMTTIGGLLFVWMLSKRNSFQLETSIDNRSIERARELFDNFKKKQTLESL